MSVSVSAVIPVRNRAFASNTYVCPTVTPGGCLLIDPGLDEAAIEAALVESGLTPLAILCTHGHFDHLGSAEHFRRRYSIDVHLPRADVKVARASNFVLMALKLRHRIVFPEAPMLVEDGFTWSHGPDHVEFIHAPGHTPGSAIILFGGCAFTGDTVYRDQALVGSLPGADEAQLIASVRVLWDRLPEATMVFPGHGGDASFGEIKRSNVPLRRLLGLAEHGSPWPGLP